MDIKTNNTDSRTSYDANKEMDADAKLKHFLDDYTSFSIDTDKIKLRTYEKIRRHERKTQLRTMALKSLATTACLLAFFMAAVYLYNKNMMTAPTEKTVIVAKVKEKMEKLVVPVGQTRTLVLSDGTKIIANSRSKIYYPKKFRGATRDVYVDGEAYFDVAHNAAHPFIVHGEGFSLKVLGTKFNVNNYHGKQARIVLLSGSVEVTAGKKNKVCMRPDEQLLLSDGNIDALTSIDTSDCTSWTDGILALDGETIAETTSRLESFYGVNIVCSPSLSDTRLYGKLELKDNITDVIKIITQLSGTKYKKTDNMINITR